MDSRKRSRSPGLLAKRYAFDISYLKRFCFLHSFLFPGIVSASFGYFVLLLCFAALEQFLAYRVGLISGLFYKVLGDKDIEGFRTAVWKSVLQILAMTATRSGR